MKFSMKVLLIAFALVAMGCAAIFYPNEYFTTGFITATLLIMMFSLLTACVSRGSIRAYWIGFTVFGSIYFFAAFYGDLQPNYRNEYTFRLITSRLLYLVDLWLNHLRPGRGVHNISTYLDVTMPIGHAVTTVLCGFIGGATGEWLWRRHGASSNA